VLVLANVLQPLVDAEEWILERLHSIGLGWGLAIVGLTVLVRITTVPLVMRQFRAQRELRRHMPELKRLQQRHKEDKERLAREMQVYYREHGINPLGAFMPLLIQIPVFISLYYVMRSDVKSGLFGDAGFLFIPHLSDKPHGAVLAALVLGYLASQITGSLIATRTMQGGQRGLMLALPLLFAGIVARFPAGLAVYWITTSLWTLGQQVAMWRLAPALPGLSGGLSPPPAPAPEAPGTVSPARPRPPSRKRKRGHGRKRR
jgi:YidC/Oxa1 family membrane protein insertase